MPLPGTQAPRTLARRVEQVRMCFPLTKLVYESDAQSQPALPFKLMEQLPDSPAVLSDGVFISINAILALPL